MSDVGSLKETGKVDDGDLFAEFDADTREAVEGLMYLGHLEKTVDFCGHSFVLRTLRGEEELHAALASKPFIDTMGAAKAWAWAQVALALVSVDGDSNFCPPAGPDKTAHAKARFRYLTSSWYWPTCEALHGAFTELKGRQLDAIQAMENLSSGGPAASFGSATSLTGPGASPPPPRETSTLSSTDSSSIS